MSRLDVGERFQRLLSRIAPTQSEIDTAKQRAEQISTRLQKRFDIKRFSKVGSLWKGTAIRQHSDVDLFVVFARDEARKWSPDLNSGTLVRRVRNDLQSRYSATSVRRDGQAVVVRFQQGTHSIDVVPAIFDCFTQGSRAPVYLIPDGEGGWLQTSPELHRRYLEQRHETSGRKLKQLIRLMKWWSRSRFSTKALKSSYIEHFLAECPIHVGVSYQDLLADCLDRFVKHNCDPLHDPTGISRRCLHAGQTDNQEDSFLDAAEMGRRRAVAALEAEARGNMRLALNKWKLVFNGRFPA